MRKPFMVYRLFVKLSCLVAVFLFPLLTKAATITVKTAGELEKAAATAQPGDEIIIVNGTYNNWESTINSKGTAHKPIIIRGESKDGVHFTGDVSKPVFKLTGSYTVLADITFQECTLLKEEKYRGLLIDLSGTSHCRITNCTFTKNEVKGQFMPLVIVSGNGEGNRVDHCHFISNINNQELQVKITSKNVPLHTLIDHNEFRDKPRVTWKVYNGGECVQIGQDPVLLGTQQAYTVVKDNRFIHCDGEPEVISNKSSDNKYIHNYFEDCQGELVMRGGHDCLIDSNTIKGGIGGIRVNGSHHTITNNIISDVPTGIRLMYGMAKGKTETGFYIAPTNCIIKGNEISKASVGILIGDSRNVDWTGKFDTTKYPSRTQQDVPPSDNIIGDNKITLTTTPIKHND